MDSSFDSDQVWAAAAVGELLERCMRVVALQLEERARALRIELMRRGVSR